MPALCPRISVRLTDTPLADEERVAGQGTLDQVRADSEALVALGARYVVLDTYQFDHASTLHPEQSWSMFATLADRVFDLAHQTVR